MKITIIRHDRDSDVFTERVKAFRDALNDYEFELAEQSFNELQIELRGGCKSNLVLVYVPKSDLTASWEEKGRRLANCDPTVDLSVGGVSANWNIPTLAFVEQVQELPTPGEHLDWLVHYFPVDRLTVDFVRETADLIRAGLPPSDFTIDSMIRGIARSESLPFVPPQQLRDADKRCLDHEFPGQPGTQARFAIACFQALGTDSRCVSAAIAVARTALRLATLNVEGNPYQLTICFGKHSRAGMRLRSLVSGCCNAAC